MQSELAKVRAGRSATAVPGPPADCAAIQGQDQTIYPDRFRTCSDSDYVLQDFIEENGEIVITGELEFDDLQWISDGGLASDGAPEWDHGAEVIIGIGAGDLAAGTEATVASMCDGALCSVEGFGGPGGATELAPMSSQTWDFTETDINSTIADNTVDDLTHFMGIEFTVPNFFWFDNGDVFDSGDSDRTLAGRCDSDQDLGDISDTDSAPAAATTPPGCVDPRFTPVLVFDTTTNPKVGPVADHVFAAQRAIPSKYGVKGQGQPLTRDTNMNDRRMNRSVACAGIAPSCDEYPLASSHEGCAFIAPADCSAVTVPNTANQSQGGLTSTFYSSNRVVEGDPFWVKAVLADGSTSW